MLFSSSALGGVVCLRSCGAELFRDICIPKLKEGERDLFLGAQGPYPELFECLSQLRQGQGQGGLKVAWHSYLFAYCGRNALKHSCSNLFEGPISGRFRARSLL